MNENLHVVIRHDIAYSGGKLKNKMYEILNLFDYIYLNYYVKDPICSTTIEGLDEEYEVIEAELRELAAIKIEKLHLNHIKEYEVFKIKESKLSEIYDLKMKEAEALKKEYQNKIDKLTIDELKSKLKKQKTFFQRVFNK